jgi:hypothetical protein
MMTCVFEYSSLVPRDKSIELHPCFPLPKRLGDVLKEKAETALKSSGVLHIVQLLSAASTREEVDSIALMLNMAIKAIEDAASTSNLAESSQLLLETMARSILLCDNNALLRITFCPLYLRLYEALYCWDNIPKIGNARQAEVRWTDDIREIVYDRCAVQPRQGAQCSIDPIVPVCRMLAAIPQEQDQVLSIAARIGAEAMNNDKWEEDHSRVYTMWKTFLEYIVEKMLASAGVVAVNEFANTLLTLLQAGVPFPMSMHTFIAVLKFGVVEHVQHIIVKDNTLLKGFEADLHSKDIRADIAQEVVDVLVQTTLDLVSVVNPDAESMLDQLINLHLKIMNTAREIPGAVFEQCYRAILPATVLGEPSAILMFAATQLVSL